MSMQRWRDNYWSDLFIQQPNFQTETKIGNVQKKMVGCLENLFYREKVPKLNVFGLSKGSLGDYFLGLKSRKYWCEKSSNNKLLKPINLLILTQTMIVSLMSMESWYYVSQIKLVVGGGSVLVVYPQVNYSDLHLSEKTFRTNPNSNSNKIQAWIYPEIINTWN